MKKGLIVLAFFVLTISVWGKESVLKIICDKEDASIYLNGKFATRYSDPDVMVNLDPGKYKLILKKNMDDGSYYYFEKEYEFGEFAVRVIADVKMELKYSEKYYYKGAKMTGDLKFYEEYIAEYPNGKYYNDFRTYLENYYVKHSDQEEMCQKYIQMFPKGNDIKLVKAKLESLEYEKVLKTKNISLGENYLDKYPGGKFTKKIEKLIDELKPKGIVDVYPKEFSVNEPMYVYFSSKKSKAIWKYRKILKRKDPEVKILPEQMFIRTGFNGWDPKYLKKAENDPPMELAEEMGLGVWKYPVQFPEDEEVVEVNITFKDEYSNWDTNLAKDYAIKLKKDGSKYKVIEIVR